MEEDPACCVLAGGAMSKLAAKLDGLLVRNSQGRRHHMPIPWEVKNELIPLIKQNLESMMAIIIQDDGDHNSSRAVIRCLTKEVRELSYDIHDCIDEHAAAPASDHATRLLWRMVRHVRVAKANEKRQRSTVPARRRTSIKPTTTWLSERLKGRLWLLDKMREFSARSEEALRRYNSFNHPLKKQRNDGSHSYGDSSTSTSATRSGESFGSWSPPPNAHVLHQRVGIHDLALNTLKAWLTDGDSPKLKVVSMVGCGGVGKTTLANELYRRIGGHFECRAFVRMPRKPDVRSLLINILSQIRSPKPAGNRKVHDLIGDIRTRLQDKRYLIVIDDVWDRSTWDIVTRAFPDGDHCSRILIASELEDVALKCSGYEPQYVYKMKPLSEDDSRKLFFSIVTCPQELGKVSSSIIRKCDGLPLAIVTIASLLASRMGKPEQREYMDYVDKSLGYGLMTSPTLEGMKQVVNLSYRNLRPHLKACLLYLCIFPEDCIIWTDDLVKQWIAEGFICATEGKDEEETSRGYFDDLISSRLIHPIHIDGNDKVLSCTMHHVMRSHIMQESVVENFVAAIDYSQTGTRFAHKVRRLSLHFGNAEDATLSTTVRLSQVRTLAFFGAFNCVPPITEFRLLQILILHFWSEEETIKFDLTSISDIFRLRYLQVTSNVTLEIQQMQMLRRLQYLETLKLDAEIGSIISSDVVHLPRLLHLRLPPGTNLTGVGHLTSLRSLRNFNINSNSIENVRSLGELTNVQDLQLTFTPMLYSRYLALELKCLSSVLGKLNNMKCLTLTCSTDEYLDRQPSTMSIPCDVLSSVSSPPVLLQRLEWSPRLCTFSRLPQWIGHLGKLCILKIGVRELVRNDVDLLKGLRSLTVLSLYVHTNPAEIIVFTKGGFLVLKYFRFRCSVPCLKFEAEVMPNLRKLKLGFDAHAAIQYNPIPAGLDHLSGLKEISAKIGGASASEPVIRIVESALSDAIGMHPGHPTVNIQCVLATFGDKDDLNIRLQEEKYMLPQKHYELIQEDLNEQHVTIQKGSRKDAASSMFIELPPPPVRWSSVAETTSGSAWDIVNSFCPRKENSEQQMSYENVEEPHLLDTEEKDGAEETGEGFVGAEGGLGETFEGFTGPSSFSTTTDDDASSMNTESMFYISPGGKFKQKITSWSRGMLLGTGSFGAVYEGISDEGVFFAVKEVSLLDQGSNAHQSILALEQEIALLCQFEHENIVHYYGTDKEESKLYIFTELVTQGSLSSLYQKYRLRDSHVSAYTRQILNGLVYLHERNVVHRDIKCANILVHANGSVKLADFGLAKEMSKINMVVSCKGSVYWMAPEVVNPKKTYGPAADIWSLGCTVLEMLTRQRPYPNVEWTSALFKIGRGEQPPIPSLLSKRAQDFIRQCVKVDPEERPTASTLLAHPFVNKQEMN